MLPAIKHSTFIKTPSERVFETLTSAEGWDAWFTKGTMLDLKPGGKFILCWIDWGPSRATTEDRAKVLEIVPNEKFSFVWNLHEGGTTVTFTLEPRENGTMLQITDDGYKSMDYLMECATGWGEALTLLKFYLEHGIIYGTVP